VSTVLNNVENNRLKKIEYVRFPLRLGSEVFTKGYISKTKISNFVKLMSAYKNLIDLHEVDDYRVCGTSAMREAKNADLVVDLIKDKTGMEIEIIDGVTEASLIHEAITDIIEDKTYLHMDVGGGSTEVIIYEEGKEPISYSFNIGSIRKPNKQVRDNTWQELEKWIIHHTEGLEHRPVAIGTGGNITKLFELAGKLKGDQFSLKQLKEISIRLSEICLKDRIKEFNLNPDRADVIVPASKIYRKVMRLAKSPYIIVPDVGLKDGILNNLMAKHNLS